MPWRSNPLLGYWQRMCAEPTAAEAALEPAIAALGERYRHQYPFWGLKYFADFALLDRKLIIEVDGASHNSPAQKQKDLKHTLEVLEQGWRVYRITNEQALKYPAESVACVIRWSDEVPDKAQLASVYQAQLARLHLNYPKLLAASAKKAKSRRPPAKAVAAPRRKRAAQFPAKS